MAYNNAIPAANDLLSQSQQDIQQNFAAIQTLVGVNHINFGAVGEGKHLYLQLPEHAAPVTAVNEAGFYANVGATSTVTELFFRRENNGASIPMTECLAAAAGWTFLPSGIMLQWGSATMNGGVSNLVVNLPRTFPTAIYSVTATPNDTPTGNHTDIIMAIQATSTTQITAKRKTNFGTACSFNFLAIGA